MATQSVIGAVESALHAAAAEAAFHATSILAQPTRRKASQKRSLFPKHVSNAIVRQNQSRFAPSPWITVNIKENERRAGATYIGLNLLDFTDWVKQYRVEHRQNITRVTIAIELMEHAVPPREGIAFVARPSGELLLLKCTPNGFTDFDDKPYEREVEVLGEVCYMAECFR